MKAPRKCPTFGFWDALTFGLLALCAALVPFLDLPWFAAVLGAMGWVFTAILYSWLLDMLQHWGDTLDLLDEKDRA